jgi:hypothetical protein
MQPQSTRVEEPTLLCNHLASSFRLFRYTGVSVRIALTRPAFQLSNELSIKSLNVVT